MSVSARSPKTPPRGRSRRDAPVEKEWHLWVQPATRPQVADDSHYAIIERIEACLADCRITESFPVRLGKLLRISTKTADDIIAGVKPLTAPMIARLAIVTEISAHWLLTGLGSKDPDGTSDDKSMEFLNAFRSMSPTGQRLIEFMLYFDDVMAKLPFPARNRVLASLLPFSDPAASSSLPGLDFAWVPNAIGRTMARYAIGRIELDGLKVLFTPVHEVLGIYGPEEPHGIDGYLLR